MPVRPSLESALGYGLGCAVVASVGLVAIAALFLVAMTFPVTLAVVIASIAVLALVRRRKAR